jgi:methylenetetrahydrofolate--tRNA-(uracil-5-)-methyltransferase
VCSPTIVATGPLTSDSLSADIARFVGETHLYFYDAVSPIVHADTIDHAKVFRASRWGRSAGRDRATGTRDQGSGIEDRGRTPGDRDRADEGDYLTCPFDAAEYARFYDALVSAERVALHEMDKARFFEGCLPIEVMADRGVDTLRFGPMKPVGLQHPETGEKPYAVVQLRQDNVSATLYNMVGFQTHLTWPEQQRVFRLIPGLETAEFVRYGVMHRNTYINSPKVLLPTLQTREQPEIFFAGQITGVEGYVESAASGLVAGINASRLIQGLEPYVFPAHTAHGALCHYITQADPAHFQPMNINFGLLPPLEHKIKDKKLKNRTIADRALAALREFI